jgi:hypothetical protein
MAGPYLQSPNELTCVASTPQLESSADGLTEGLAIRHAELRLMQRHVIYGVEHSPLRLHGKGTARQDLLARLLLSDRG